MKTKKKYKLKAICNKAVLLLLVSITTGNIFNAANAVSYGTYESLYKDLPFEMPILKRPVFPAEQVNIFDFGGIPDGIAMNTEAFSKAINTLSERGGGTLIVPSGIWFTGPIVMKSNINLHLERGALILFSADFDLYPLVETVYEGLHTRRCQSPISGRNLENIAITGEGAINGAGEAWRPLKKIKVTADHWKSVVESGGVLKGDDLWFPSERALRGDNMKINSPGKEITEEEWLSVKDYLRPVMISFIECKNVFLEGVLFENSPSWNIHPLMCENVIIDNIFVRNPSYSQNGDGVDLESCVNSIIVNSSFDVGDDAICIKSGKDEEGRRRARPTENVIVDNCRVFQGHGGFVVGSEMSGGVKNISVSNCQFLGTDVGLRFKSNRGRGGVVENIYVNNINMFDIVTESFLFDLYYGGAKTEQSFSVDETTPAFRNIYVNNLTSRNARQAMFFNGLPEMNITNINVENTTITAIYGAELIESSDITFRNVKIYPEEGPALILNNVQDMEISEFTYPETLENVVLIQGGKTKNIKLPEAINTKSIVNK